MVRANGDNWEYLLVRRVPKLGTFWQGVTGAAEEGETLVQAAKREVLEETGFSPVKLDSIDFTYRYPVLDEWRGAYGPEPTEIVEHVFVARSKAASLCCLGNTTRGYGATRMRQLTY